MTKVRISGGACGYTAIVKVQALDRKKVHINIITACRALQSFNEELGVVDWTKGVFDRFCDSIIYKTAHETLKHTDCPVPMAVIKAIQVELKGAVPKDVIVKFEND
ncbi:MAG: hypothetical protein CVU89_12200 [Firmicutes bacterium HGW-Firmicutes-14]|nr:MAG: hypothetical protein CVU89_12200 [Firmicutes bacterium HGW-Firmicutes-14]